MFARGTATRRGPAPGDGSPGRIERFEPDGPGFCRASAPTLRPARTFGRDDESEIAPVRIRGRVLAPNYRLWLVPFITMGGE